MRKFLLLIALMVSGIGIVSAQSVGDYITKSYSGYSLKFTVTSVSPAECEVVCSTKPTSNKSITIPSSVTIKSKTFNVTSVGKEGFSSCDYITSVKLPNTLTIIGNLAFYKCKGLSSINLPENLTSIGNAAFMYCNKITNVVIPEGVKVINYQTFSDCSTLKTVKLSSNCTKIDNYAFRYCFALENIEIPNGVTYIGSYSFYGAAFTKVIIPHSVTTLGDFAFSGCSKLTELTIGNGVKTIDRNVIETYNSPLAKLTIGSSVTNIGLDLGNCSELTEIHSLALQPPTLGYSLNKNTKVYVPYGCYNKYKNATYWKDCTILEGGAIGQLPVGAKLMSDNVCYEVIVEGKEVSVTSLSSGKYTGVVVIPSTIIHSGITYGVTEIGKAAFYDCSNLTSIEIPNSIKDIVGADKYYEGAFSTCPNLKTVTFSENSQLAHIGSFAFYGCSNLISINIPNNVTRIEGAAFTQCTKLKSVTFEEDSKLAFIQGFSYNTSLTSIEIPASVTELGANAFNGCTKLTAVTFEENSQLETIGDNAFYNCSGLISIYIPSKVVSINNAAFYGCKNLKEIICFNITPATITSNNVFSGIMSDARIYVPIVSLNNYKNNWSSYSSKIVGMPTYTEDGWTSEPTAEDYVAVNAPMVISGNTRSNNDLTVNTLGLTENGSLTIKDGGQLIANKVIGEVTVEKEIAGYQQSESKWYTIASPLKAPLTITPNSTLLTPHSNYDLYRYDEPTYTWQNYKNSANNGFTNLESGRGYLYANSEDVTLSFTGNINTNEVSYNLTKDGEMLNGFHLIGNPFTHNITFAHLNAKDAASLANGYYVLSGDGAWGATLGDGAEDVIKVGQGALIKAENAGTLVICCEPQSSRSQQPIANSQQLKLTVANDKYSDKAFVVFGKGVGLDKINHENENIPLLYIPVDGTDYAIAMVDMNVNEIPVSFEAMTMGEYTISLRQDNCEFEELYLLDKETNTTVNILAEDYTFIATSNENPERFMLLKKANGQQPTANSHFAYVNNGDIVIQDINGCADIKIFDAMGRCLYNGNCCTDAIHRVPMGGFSTGVYMIQKADENGVKVQKVIID